jgi:TonB family protein
LKRSWALSLLGVLLTLFPTAGGRGAAAQTRPMSGTLTPGEAAKRLEQWEKEYEGILSDLKAGDHRSEKRARTHAATLFQDVVDHALGGEALAQTAGQTLTLLGIAEARLGDGDAAAWHWQMAQNVFPALRGFDFADFPDVAPFMKESLLPETPPKVKKPEPTGGRVKPEANDPVDPPRLKRRIRPSYPAGLAGHLVGGETVVHAFIDPQGKVRDPVLAESCGYVSADLAAMEALREWRYEPARRDGKPIQVFLRVTINFKPIP